MAIGKLCRGFPQWSSHVKNLWINSAAPATCIAQAAHPFGQLATLAKGVHQSRCLVLRLLRLLRSEVPSAPAGGENVSPNWIRLATQNGHSWKCVREPPMHKKCTSVSFSVPLKFGNPKEVVRLLVWLPVWSWCNPSCAMAHRSQRILI